MSEIRLTQKQENFCNYYMECSGNASEAYRKAYSCENMRPDTINRKAHELYENGKVTARLSELQEEQKKKSDITKERILKELECVLDANIKDYVDFDGKTLRFKSFDDLTEKQLKAIESIKQGKRGIELKLHGKSWTIERICKMLGFDKPTIVDLRNSIVGIDTGLED